MVRERRGDGGAYGAAVAEREWGGARRGALDQCAGVPGAGARAGAGRGAVPGHVLVYNEDRARPRNVGPQHIDGANEGLINALDALEDGDTAAATEACGHAWLATYGIDVDASVTDVVGTFALGA